MSNAVALEEVVPAEESAPEEALDAIGRMDEVFGPDAYALRVTATPDGQATIVLVAGENPNDESARELTGPVTTTPRLAATIVAQVFEESAVSEPGHVADAVFGGEPDESASRDEILPIVEQIIAAEKADGSANPETGEATPEATSTGN